MERNTIRDQRYFFKLDIKFKFIYKDYELCILETEPRNAVRILGCMNFHCDFAPPVGYQEPKREIKPVNIINNAVKIKKYK